MPEIIPSKGRKPLSVSLSMDLGDYCKAYTARHEAPDVFEHEREGLLSQVQATAGRVHWNQIKAMLSEQCNLDDPIQNKLQVSLKAPAGAEPLNPLAIESLDDGFVELLKNSIDTKLEQYWDHGIGNQLLEMDIELTLVGTTIIVTISDNGDGFSGTYMDNFDPYIARKGYKFEVPSDLKKRRDPEFFLGGEGQGMPRLYNLIIDGEIFERIGVSKPMYSGTVGCTVIRIANSPLNGGAVITLASPVDPFALYQEEAVFTDSPHADTPDSAFSHGTEGGPAFFHQAPSLHPALLKLEIPKRKKKDVKTFTFGCVPNLNTLLQNPRNVL